MVINRNSRNKFWLVFWKYIVCHFWNNNNYAPPSFLQNLHFSLPKCSWVLYQSYCEQIVCVAKASALQRAVHWWTFANLLWPLTFHNETMLKKFFGTIVHWNKRHSWTLLHLLPAPFPNKQLAAGVFLKV